MDKDKLSQLQRRTQRATELERQIAQIQKFPFRHSSELESAIYDTVYYLGRMALLKINEDELSELLEPGANAQSGNSTSSNVAKAQEIVDANRTAQSEQDACQTDQ